MIEIIGLAYQSACTSSAKRANVQFNMETAPQQSNGFSIQAL